MKVVLPVAYNSQRDNPVFAGVPPSSQCGYTAAAVALSLVLPEFASDAGVARLFAYVETVGRRSILTDPRSERPADFAGRLGACGEAYAIAADQLLAAAKRPERVRWFPRSGSPDFLKAAIDQGSPAMLSTLITKSGHFIPVIGYDDSGWICHDPFGNALTDYADRNGAAVHYPFDWLRPRLAGVPPMRFWFVSHAG